MKHCFVGFGFGPIQSGLFAREAFASGNFSEIVISEVDAALVDAVRANGDSYALNIAHADGIETVRVKGVQMLNPLVEGDSARLCGALRRATEIVTSLPSVDFFARGGDASVAALIAGGLQSDEVPATVIYTAENNNHAAEALAAAVSGCSGTPSSSDGSRRASATRPHAFLNTVIGKMSQVITDAEEIRRRDLAPMAPGFPRAFLVEAFNHILVTRAGIDGFEPGIRVFEEKDDLLPFEEAKLYGHNAIHALLAYLGAERGATLMSDLARMPEVMDIARRAFLDESGAALIAKYGAATDALFTTDGYRAYAEDLLERIVNPHLRDALARAARDPVRKLGAEDRIFGTMRLALGQGIAPVNMAAGAAAGIRYMLREAGGVDLPAALRFDSASTLEAEDIGRVLDWLWRDASPVPEREQLAQFVASA